VRIAKLIAAIAAVLMTVVGCQSANAPSPSATLIASGTFNAKGGDVDLNATRTGDRVTGTMTVDHGDGAFTVDLQCSRTAQDGRVLIGGDTTVSTSPYATKGNRTAIVLKPGTPVHAVFAFEDARFASRAASCTAFLDGMVDRASASVIGPDALEPIEGTVKLGP